jgi:hypothetical protein
MPADLYEVMGWDLGAFIFLISPVIAVAVGLLVNPLSKLSRKLAWPLSTFVLPLLLGIGAGLLLSLGASALFVVNCYPGSSLCG